MEAEWRPVPGYEGLYQVSSHGQVRNRHGHLMSPWARPDRHRRVGYLALRLAKGSRKGRVAMAVHRIVLLAFVGPPPPGRPECAHRDGDPLNNRLENLRWASSLENHLDAVRHGRVQPKKPRPPPSPRARARVPVSSILAVIGDKAAGLSYLDIQAKHRLSAGAVWRALKGPLA